MCKHTTFVFQNLIRKEYKRLEELDLDKLEFEPIEYKSYSDEQLREIVFEDITDR